MKKILAGFSNNIAQNKNKIRVWAESFRKYSEDEIILIAANTDEKDIQALEELDLNYHLVQEEDTYFIYHKRLKHTRDFLESYDADLFLITDVFDVVFQADPFAKIIPQVFEYDLFLTSEGILISEEPWNGDVIQKVFGDEINSCLNNEILCSGVIGGKRDALIDLYNKMYEKCESGTNLHNIKDQAALILLVANNQINNYKIFSLNHGWAMHCATSGPTYFFEAWGLKNSLVRKGYGIPKLVDDIVYTEKGLIYDIVHQFNRITEWNEVLTKKYE